jgi:hypothetical protein
MAELRLNKINKFSITEIFSALKKKSPKFAKRKFSGLWSVAAVLEQYGIHFTFPSGNLCVCLGAPEGAVTLMVIFVIYTEIDCGS